MSAPLADAALDRLAQLWGADQRESVREVIAQAREANALRATNVRLNRRVQEMESAVHRVERIEARIAERAQGKPLGRIEAFFAIASSETDRDALRAQLAALRPLVRAAVAFTDNPDKPMGNAVDDVVSTLTPEQRAWALGEPKEDDRG